MKQSNPIMNATNLWANRRCELEQDLLRIRHLIVEVSAHHPSLLAEAESMEREILQDLANLLANIHGSAPRNEDLS